LLLGNGRGPLPARPRRNLGSMATILLVDNDPLQAIQRKSILERKFPDVERVRDAAEALCLVEQPQFAGQLGLVISGLHMRGIGGPEFVAELHERLPKVPVLVLGGDDETPTDYKGGWVRYLPHPYIERDMLTAAGELLGRH
jgi:CheY-like chemotaxis protein